MGTTRLFTSGLVIAGSVLAGCGGDSDESTATEPSAESATTAPAASASETADTAAAVTEASATTAGSAAVTQPTVTQPAGTAAPAATGVTECPDAAEIGSLYGAEVELDEAAAMTGAVGLVFCPYLEVLPPGSTNEIGGPAIPDGFSLTFTDQNPVVPGGAEEVVAGLGEAASWSDLGELAVWTGEQGLIVSITFPPPAGDTKTVAVAIAEHLVA